AAALVDGKTVAEQRVCEGRSAVVLQWTEVNLCGALVQPISRGVKDSSVCGKESIRLTNQVEATCRNNARRVIEEVKRTGVPSDNSAAESQTAALPADVVNPAAVLREAGGNHVDNVGSNGTVEQKRNSLVLVKDTATVGRTGATGSIPGATPRGVAA